MSEEKKKTREENFKEWLKTKKSYEIEQIAKNVRPSLNSFRDVALRLAYLHQVENESISSLVGRVLRDYLAKILKLPASPEETHLESEGEGWIKIIKETEKLLKIYEKHAGFCLDFSQALQRDWSEEGSNWKEYHDLLVSATKQLEKDEAPTITLQQISSLTLFNATGSPLLTSLKNIKNEISSKKDLEKLKNLRADVEGAMNITTKIKASVDKHRRVLSPPKPKAMVELDEEN